MKKSLLLILCGLMSSGCSRAAEPIAPVAAPAPTDASTPVAVVPVGKGSYASNLPPDAQKVAKDIPTRDLFIIGKDRPIPTNKWWTNLITDKYVGRLWAFPHMVEANGDGVKMTFPTRWNEEGRDPVNEFPIELRGENFHPADARAKEWGDWTLTFRMAESDTKYCDVTMGRGMPAVWLEYSGVTPIIKSGNDAKWFGEAGSAVTLPSASGVLGLEYGNRNFGIFAPDGTKFSQNGDQVKVEFNGAKTFLVVCPLTQKTDLKYFRQFAYAIPRDSKISWEYSADKAQVTTKWHVETEALQGTEKRVLQGWLPHHWRDTTNDLRFDGREYLAPRGKLKIAPGDDFQITYGFTGVPPFLPAPKKTGLANDFDETRMKDYLTRYATRKDYGEDTYWGGKHVLQFAQYMTMAKQMNDPSYETLKNMTRTALSDWFTYTPGEKAHYFARYPKWHALVGFNASYGSEGFNDQHFHYGYFTYAAALLGMHDSQFLKDYGPMVRLVAKEYANWDRSDTNFPFLRTFDIWEGHSWAGGFSSGGGNNQESSSEAMQSWAGLYFLGQALGDKEMTAAGAAGYAMESRATTEYWFNIHGGNWSPNYKHPVVGMVWSGGQLYGTYFTGDPAWIYGIQWLPISPALAYLVQDPEFAKTNLRAMFDDRRNSKEGTAEISKMGPALGNVILGHVAQLNPDWVAQQEDELWAKNDPVAHDNDTPGMVYYAAHSNRVLGQIAWEYSMSLPLSRVYYNPRTKVTTYTVFNPTDKAQTATVYKSGKKVGVLSVPPRELKTANQLDK
jgi:endoglucanase Acf2